jgi:outer membrane protein assembly factor BamB
MVNSQNVPVAMKQGQTLRKNYSAYILSDYRDLREESNDYRWLPIGENLELIDIRTGLVCAEIPMLDNQLVTVVEGNSYALIVQGNDLEVNRSTRFNTSIYDIARQKTIFQTDDKGTYATVQNKVIYFLLDGRPTAFDTSSGQMLWKSELFGGTGQMISLKGRLIVPATDSIYIIDQRFPGTSAIHRNEHRIIC